MRKGNKLDFYWFLSKDKLLNECLPYTVGLNEIAFSEMLDYYESIIVKPTVSSGGGKEIYKVIKLSRGIEVHHRDKRNVFRNKREAFAFIEESTFGFSRPYIIQEAIDLLTVDGNPVDFRAIVQRRIDSSEWQVTGKFGKVAKEGFIVTNLKYHRAGLMSIDEALAALQFTWRDGERILEAMDKVCIRAAEKLQEAFPDKTMWGLDIGVNHSFQVKIIEVNANPGNNPFRDLEDDRMHKRITSIRNYNRLARRRRKGY
ncbi:hypothetical protein D1B31_13415 [Neobacillus notoginsengisoli]|uniref:YheC/YheD family protein n=1 Tax=Neobacillus notoginsengisoli TaxID=1578198 RepID=A0A417YSJ4_9BACI|nr:YheC/YheD family protein [Neobacillus notoginsengisoli]RHW38964.1 hypothetical protein D1B31_13415 [Neobacillus notoginsengisoli]